MPNKQEAFEERVAKALGAERSISLDDLQPEYDFHQLRVVARGPGRKAPRGLTVELAPDVAEAFPSADAVDETHRLLLRTVAAGTRKRPISAT